MVGTHANDLHRLVWYWNNCSSLEYTENMSVKKKKATACAYTEKFIRMNNKTLTIVLTSRWWDHR